MESRFVAGLLTIFLLVARTPPCHPMRRCASNSFFNRSTGLCQECSPYCPAGTAMTRDCRRDADVVCTALPTGCASGWYLDARKGRCRECTRFCAAPLSVVTPCRRNADTVCGARTKQTKRTVRVSNPGPRAPPTTTIPSSAPPVTTHRPSETIDPEAVTKPGPDQPVFTTRFEHQKTPENSPTNTESISTERETTIVPGSQRDPTLRESILTLPRSGGAAVTLSSSRQTTDDTKFYLWVVVSVLVSVVVVVAASLAAYCTRLKCRDCVKQKAQKMGVAGSGGIPKTESNNQDGGFQIDLHLDDPTSLQPSPLYCGRGGHGPNPTASLAVADERVGGDSCACAACIPPSIARHPSCWSYGDDDDAGCVHQGRSSSLNNMYPAPSSRRPVPLTAPSRVLLRSDGTTETQLARCACAGEVRRHHGCRGRCGCHLLPPNCSISTFSVESGSGSEYTV